ncbi:MAG: hypothetical protein ACKO40_06215 [Planctomycetaceae bacterium]
MPVRGPSLLAGLAALVASAPAAASDLPPELVAKFTRQVQPLLVNRCAAGACHGGPAGHEPRFERGPASARPDRLDTLANIKTFLDTVGSDRDPKRLVTLLSGRHPVEPTKSRLAAAPLTASERMTIETWLTAVRTAETGHRRDPAVRQVSAEDPAGHRPNPFRDLLDAAANPPAFEEPAQPQGVIFKQDDGTGTEPPVAPSPPAATGP